MIIYNFYTVGQQAMEVPPLKSPDRAIALLPAGSSIWLGDADAVRLSRRTAKWAQHLLRWGDAPRAWLKRHTRKGLPMDLRAAIWVRLAEAKRLVDDGGGSSGSGGGGGGGGSGGGGGGR